MRHLPVLKFGWPQLSMRACFLLIGMGICVEALIILFHVVIKRLQEVGVTPLGFHFTTLYSGNAALGLLGTLLLVCGVVCLIRELHKGKMAILWAYLSAAFIVSYKVLDTIYSFHLLRFQDILRLSFDIDVLMLNLLLIGSIAALLIAVVCAFFDLHKAERVLEERNRALSREIRERRLLTTAIEHAAESILITDAAGNIQYVNPAFEHLTGYAAAEVVGRTPNIVKSGHHDDAFYRELWSTLSTGAVWRGHFLNRRKDGFLFNEDATISAIQDEHGKITHYVAVKRDVTREKQLEQQLQQSQKLEAIGTLAGGIAHDLNNVLAVIIGHCEISMERLAPDHPVRKSLEVIMRTSHRSSQLIKRLLVFSRQGVSEDAPMEPAPLVREQMKIIRSYLPSNISISDSIDRNVGYIFGEPIEIQQIIFNLCTNANHAMQPVGGTLKIGLDRVHVEEQRIVATGVLPPGDYARLYVCDTGCGMDEEIQKRVFDPFFTTKDPGMGTGLGLSMVHGSVTRNGGGIDVTSTPGQGSQFELYWLLLQHEPCDAVQKAPIPDGNGRLVLVVDDMPDFKELVEANLNAHGFKTAAFASADAALTFFHKNGDTVDIALVDYMMPDLNGTDLARRLHEIRPGLPVVLLSGYSSSVTTENAAEHGFSAVLGKPVETAQLINTLLRCVQS